MRRNWTAIILIASMSLALVILDQFFQPVPRSFLELALSHKHTVLLTLAAQAGLIFVLTSGVADKPLPKASAITAALIIFAAAIGQLGTGLKPNLPTGTQLAAVTLSPIGMAITNMIPLPRTTVGMLAAIMASSAVAMAVAWAVASTKVGPVLAIALGADLVTAALTFVIIGAYILMVASGLGLVGTIQGKNTRPRI